VKTNKTILNIWTFFFHHWQLFYFSHC